MAWPDSVDSMDSLPHLERRRTRSETAAQNVAGMIRSCRDKVCEAQNLRTFEEEAHDAWAMGIPVATVKTLFERRVRISKVPLPYDNLLRGASLGQRSWMQFKVRFADGTRLGAASVVPNSVRRLIVGCFRIRPERRQILEVQVRLTGLHLSE